jgi:hypothetical protein
MKPIVSIITVFNTTVALMMIRKVTMNAKRALNLFALN